MVDDCVGNANSFEKIMITEKAIKSTEKIVPLSEKIGGDLGKMIENMNLTEKIESGEKYEAPTKLATEIIELNTEKMNGIIEKIPEKIPEKRYRGCRGPDKNPRKLNQNSLLNLKPFSHALGTPNPYQFRIEQPQKTPSNSWVWIGLLILTAIIIGIVIWILYRRRTKNSDVLDDSDIIEVEG